MKMKMKMTMVVAIAAVMCAGTSFAKGRPGGGHHGGGPRPMMGGHHGGGPRPMMGGHHGGGPHGGGFRPAPHHPGGHHHGGSFWGRGGRNFWPGFVGGVIGGALVDTVVSPAPVVVTTPVVTTPVVTTPVVTTRNVWVEGCYVNQVLANGTVIRVWQPGHYETRQVVY